MDSNDYCCSNDIDEWKNIIYELSVKATNDVVRDVIRLYDPAKPSKDLVSVFKSKCLLKPLKETLQFLGIEANDMKKPEVIDRLIMRVQNLFPDICQICKQKYCIKLEDEYFLSCGSCGQEVHKECYSKVLSDNGLLLNELPNMQIFNIPGFHYLCNRCEEDNIISRKHCPERMLLKEQLSQPINQELNPQTGNLDPTLTTQPNDINPPSTPISLNPLKEIQQYVSPVVVIKPTNSNDENTTSSQPEAEVCRPNFRARKMQKDLIYNAPLSMNENAPLSMNNKSQEQLLNVKTQEQHLSISDNDNPAKKMIELQPKICKYYRQGNCKHGLSGKKGGNCKFSHPKPCNKLLKHGTHSTLGCTKGKSCEYYHPKMCFESISKRVCYDKTCKYVHVKKTDRNKHESAKHLPSQEQDLTHTFPKITPQDQNNNFLEMIHCLIQTVENRMDAKLESIRNMLTTPKVNQMPPTNNHPWMFPHHPIPTTPNIQHHPVIPAVPNIQHHPAIPAVPNLPHQY